MLEKTMMRFLGLLALGFGLAFSGKVPSSVNSGKVIESKSYPEMTSNFYIILISKKTLAKSHT